MTPFDRIQPSILYGTAWKEELTESCVLGALSAGFRAIDTANQRRHYFEEGVGNALVRSYAELGLEREGLFLQSKFTYAGGQDHRKPYDETASLWTQVHQSFESSLRHLHTDYLDSFVLHGPSTSVGLTDADWETWGAMEDIARSGAARSLGISNVNHDQLVMLNEKSILKPAFVQNRCFAETRWDKKIRDYCSAHGILYQGFSLLTANWKFLGSQVEHPEGRSVPRLVFPDGAATRLSPEMDAIVRATGRSVQQIVFRFAQQIGMIPLTGTRSPEHMQADLEIPDFALTESQMGTIENIAFSSRRS